MGQDAVDAIGPGAVAGVGRRDAADVADHRLDPPVACGDDLLVQVDLLAGGSQSEVVDGLAGNGRQALDVVLVGGVRQQRPDRPGPTGRRRPVERSAPQGAFHLRYSALHRRREPRPRDVAARRQLDGIADGLPQAVESLAGGADRRHDRYAEPIAQPARVDRHAGRLRLVDHVQRDHHRHAGLDDLQDQIETALYRPRVDDDHHRVGHLPATAEHLVDGDLLVRRVGAEAVGAGQIHQLDAGPAGQRNLPRRPGHGNARIVAHLGARAGQGVEDGGLARVGVAGDEHPRDPRPRGRIARRMGLEPGRRRGRRAGSRIHLIERRQRHFRSVGGPEAQQVAAQADLQRVAERRAADHLDPRAREQAHLHEPAADTAVAVDAVDDAALANRQLIERPETLVHVDASRAGARGCPVPRCSGALSRMRPDLSLP